MHGLELTPTQRQIADRRKQFQASIAAKADALARAKKEAALSPFQRWLDAQPKCPSTRFWFSIEDGPKHSVRSIQDAVCKKFNVDLTGLLQRRRLKRIVLPRQIAMYLCRELTTQSLPEIGRRFGGFDHTSVMSNTRKIDRLIKTDSDIATIVKELREEIDGHTHSSCLPADQAIGATASDSSPPIPGGTREAEKHPPNGIGVAA